MRRRVAAALAVLLTATLLASAGAEADTLWSGYRIEPTGAADGGFIGARRTDRRVTYRIDPEARRAAHGYRRGHLVGPRRRTEARAAWILSKYGAVRIADQAAAVDVATYALLAGRPLDGARATRRMRQSGHAAMIRALAHTMLVRSRSYAGPYRLLARAAGDVVGGQVSVQVQVLSRRDEPLDGLPVRVRLGSSTPRALETDARGRVATQFRARRAGYLRVRVRVGRVPEWRLLMREPRRRGAARIVIAGRKTLLRTQRRVPVQARPTVSLRPLRSPADGRRPVGALFTLAGTAPGSSSRFASVTSYGPFPTAASATCSGSGTPWGAVSVSRDASYATPQRTIRRAGYYAWKVAVAADPVNLAAQACGAATRVRTLPRLGLDAVETRAARGTAVRARGTLANLPWGYDGRLTFRLYGPYQDRAHATCYGGRQVGVVSVPVTGAGAYVSPRVKVPKAGVYAWGAVLPAGEFSLGTHTRCGAYGTTVRVS